MFLIKIISIRSLLAVVFLFLTLNSFVQGQEVCGTPSNSIPQHFGSDGEKFSTKATPEGICINVFFHIVRKSNGSGGFDQANINLILKNLNEAFNPHRIYINSLGVDFIDNSNYYDLTYSGFDELISKNNVSDGINFYLVNSAQYKGRAEDILSRNLVVVNNSALSSTSPHELGHCLNLWHTHRGRGCDGAEGCPENIDETNCASCGDFVCDTPADPCIYGLVDENCQYIGGGGFNPDVTNIMSYGDDCRVHFSTGQASRMRNAIKLSTVLQPIISNNTCEIPEIVGESTICLNSNETITYSLINGGNSVTWDVSPNLQIVSSSNSSVTVKVINSIGNEEGFIEADLSLETIRKDILIGIQKPTGFKSIIIDPFLGRIKARVDPVPDAIEYIWYLDGVEHTAGSGANSKSITMSIPKNDCNTRDYRIGVKAVNSCGISLEYYELHQNPCFEVSYSYAYYPNPVSEKIILTREFNEDKKNTLFYNAAYSKDNYKDFYELYDFNGNIIKRGYLLNKTTIDLTNLFKGNYILKIRKKNYTFESHHIIIK